MTAHNSFGDIADRHIGPDPDSIDGDPEWLMADWDAMFPVQPEPVEDASRYATEAEYYAGVWTDADPALDLTDLLDSPCLLPLADDLGSYDALSGHLSNLELTSDAAAELRARVRKDAA